MLPSQERTSRFTALQTMFYSIVLVPLAIIPRVIGITGNIGMWVCILCGAFYFFASVRFYIHNNYKTAKGVMYASFIYLPVVLLALLFNKM